MDSERLVVLVKIVAGDEATEVTEGEDVAGDEVEADLIENVNLNDTVVVTKLVLFPVASNPWTSVKVAELIIGEPSKTT